MMRARTVSRRLARLGVKGLFQVTTTGRPDGRSYKAGIPCPACGGTCNPTYDRLPAAPFHRYLDTMHVSQALIAERIGISRRTVIRVLHRDRINICCAERYVTALGLTLYDVWGDSWQ